MKKKTQPPGKLGIPIREIMTRDLTTIHPAASVQEAAKRMHEHDVGMLPVLDGKRLLGLITDRDITVRAIAQGRSAARTKVSEIMTTDIFFCYDHEDLQEAVESFERKQIRRLPILNRKKQLVGVLSIGDLAVDTANKNLAGQVLQRVSEPERISC